MVTYESVWLLLKVSFPLTSGSRTPLFTGIYLLQSLKYPDPFDLVLSVKDVYGLSSDECLCEHVLATLSFFLLSHLYLTFEITQIDSTNKKNPRDQNTTVRLELKTDSFESLPSKPVSSDTKVKGMVEELGKSDKLCETLSLTFTPSAIEKHHQTCNSLRKNGECLELLYFSC